MESDQFGGVEDAVRNLTMVVFGFQLTAVGLFDGSSFLVIAIGFFISLAGLIDFYA